MLDNLPRNDTPPYQVWLKMVERFRRYRPDKIEHTDRLTDGHVRLDRRTDRQSDSKYCAIHYLRCQAIQNIYKFYAYVTNNVEIIPRTHNGKDAVLDENLNECGKVLWKPLTATSDPHANH